MTRAWAWACIVACGGGSELDVSVATDVTCSNISDVVVAWGPQGGAATDSTTLSTCDNGTFGTAIISPASSAPIEIVVGASVGGADPTTCVSTPGPTCIVARRVITPNGERLFVPVSLNQECVGLPCNAQSTCLLGTCVPN